VFDSDKGKNVSKLDVDDWDELYEASRLEFRLYHSKTIYSRTKVVALTPSAVGETGDLILDEVGRVKNFRDVVEAITPIISSNPDFRCIYTTTPPPDDAHYSFDLMAPPVGTELPVNPRGNWYQSELGVHVLRVTADDAYADGVPLYDDDTGAAITPAQAYAAAHDKEAWRRNYGCEFVIGGTSACGLLQLDTAQRRGIGKCALFVIHDDKEFEAALEWIKANVGGGKVALGWDLATTEKATSNPSALAIVEQDGNDIIARAVLLWKLANPDIAIARVYTVIHLLTSRSNSNRPRRLCIDATSERYFAQTCRKELGGLLPVELVVGSETVPVPGRNETMTMKQFLGGMLVAELDDNHLTLPPDRYLREDWRIVRKEKGAFVCEPDCEGRHGDTFDSVKLGLRALRSNVGGMTTSKGIASGHNGRNRLMPHFQSSRISLC
jgi:hypothetical protein